MCDVLWGVPGCVTKCDRGRGRQNWPKIAWRTLWTAPYRKMWQRVSSPRAAGSIAFMPPGNEMNVVVTFITGNSASATCPRLLHLQWFEADSSMLPSGTCRPTEHTATPPRPIFIKLYTYFDGSTDVWSKDVWSMDGWSRTVGQRTIGQADGSPTDCWSNTTPTTK